MACISLKPALGWLQMNGSIQSTDIPAGMAVMSRIADLRSVCPYRTSMHHLHRMDDIAEAGQMDPVLYSFRRCPFAMRARLAIAVSSERCVLREVKLSAKPESMLAASPKGTVPVLVLPGGIVIDESLEIMRWALAIGDPEGWLEGNDPALIERNDGPFKHDLDRYKYPDRFGVDPLKHRGLGMDFLRELNGRLGRTNKLCGPVRSLTDAAIMPFVRQFAAVDQNWFNGQSLPQLKAWLAELVSSELFNAIMFRVAPWAPGNRPVWLAPASMSYQPMAQL